MSRYEALLRVCDMACAHASSTRADQRPEFYETLASALEDDCPKQSEVARRTAETMRLAEEYRAQLLHLLHET